MYGVSKINIEPSLMMISVQDAEFKGNTMARYLQIFADTGVVVDMISQSAPHGTSMDFSFTAYSSDLPLVMKAISAANLDKDAKASPLISVGYSKLNLFGEEMVTSCGVAARALNALAMAGIEVLLITTSDLDISLLVRSENEDAAYEALKKLTNCNNDIKQHPCLIKQAWVLLQQKTRRVSPLRRETSRVFLFYQKIYRLTLW